MVIANSYPMRAHGMVPCPTNIKDIRGIKVDNEEIKLSLFADDLTAFLKNNLSVKNFLKLIDEYGNCSGLRINHDKSEILLLGNHGYSVQEDKSVPGNLKIKKSAKILGIHFSYQPTPHDSNKS